MNIYPVPIPSSLFQPIANHWLPAHEGRVIISTCEGVDYLSLDGECRLAHTLPKEKKGESYSLLYDLLNLVREPVQWDDLAASVPTENLISWCGRYGVLLPMELMPNGGEGVRLRTAQVEVLTLYLIYHLWQSVLRPPARTRDVLEQERKERLRLILLLLRRYFSRDLASPAWPLRIAATQNNAEQQRLLLETFLQQVVNQKLNGLTPAISLLHQPRQTLMQAESPMAVAYWQLAALMLKPNDVRHYHLCPSCGRSFYGRPNRKYCPRCDRRTEHSRRRRAAASVNAMSLNDRGNRRGKRRVDQGEDTQEGRG